MEAELLHGSLPSTLPGGASLRSSAATGKITRSPVVKEVRGAHLDLPGLAVINYARIAKTTERGGSVVVDPGVVMGIQEQVALCKLACTWMETVTPGLLLRHRGQDDANIVEVEIIIQSVWSVHVCLYLLHWRDGAKSSLTRIRIDNRTWSLPPSNLNHDWR